MEYTYDDIVTAKDIATGKVKVEDIIGKKGWFLDCIPRDLSKKRLEFTGSCGDFSDFDYDANFPFYDGENSWQYFLPEKEKSYEERQAEWVKSNNLKVGDKVRIVKEWPGFEDGSNPTIGMTGKIESVDDLYAKVRLDSGDWWYYKLDALKPLKDEPEYIPFNLSLKEDRDFLRGQWIKQKDSPKKTEMQIIGFRITETDKEWCCDLGSWVPAEDLLSDWVFLYGSPVGRLANDQQITSKQICACNTRNYMKTSHEIKILVKQISK